MSLKSANMANQGIKYAGEDFPGWKFNMEMLLKERGLWTVVEQGVEAEAKRYMVKKKLKGDDAEAAMIVASEMNEKALAKIVLHLDERYQAVLRGEKSAKEAWRKLSENYEKNTAEVQMLLRDKLLNERMGAEDNMEEHLNKMIKMADQLQKAGGKEDEKSVVHYILRSLPESWSSYVSSMKLQGAEFLTLESVRRHLLTEAETRKQAKNERAAAMVARENKPRKRCYTCGSTEHLAYACPKNPNRRPRNCLVCGSTAHFTRQCPKRYMEEQANQATALQQSEECNVAQATNKTKTSAYVDSGATTHMIASRELLTNIKPLSPVVQIGVAESGRFVQAEEKGEICLTGEGGAQHKFQALHVPSFEKNLLSVSKLCKDTKGQVTFTEEHCVAQNRHGETIASGERHGDLYKVELGVPTERAELADTEALNELALWHVRMGHLGWDALRQLQRAECGVDIPQGQTKPNAICQSCASGKATAKAVKKRKPEQKRAKDNLERIHSDICGPVLPQSRKGNNQFILFIDEKTRYVIGHTMKAKSEAPEKTRRAIKEFQRLDGKRKVRKFRSDNAKELISKAMDTMLLEEGIQPEHSAPYSPSQNGLAERYNRNVLEMMRCLLHQSPFSNTFWEDAFDAALYILNRRVNKQTGRIPYEDITGEKVDLNHMRAFGAEAYVLVQPQGNKLAPRSTRCFFLGYVQGSEATYMFWDPQDKKVITSKNAVFDENSVLKHSWPNAAQPVEITNRFAVLRQDDPEEDKNERMPKLDDDGDSDDSGSDAESDMGPAQALDDQWLEEPAADQNGSQGNESEDDAQPARRSGRLPKYNKFLLDGHVSYAAAEAFVATPEDSIPPPEEAYKQPEWRQAIHEEYDALIKNGTWKLVRLPPGRSVVDNKWVLKIKRGPDGKISRYKARLVAKGFSQVPGQDYTETFAPVAKMNSFKLLLALAASLKLEIDHLDVKTAFLQGELEEEIFMKQPPMFEESEEEDKVCQLLKPIYGLKQSSRCWNKKFHTTATKLGFQRTRSDYCVYVMRRGKELAILLIWVDDILLASNSPSLKQEIKNHLKQDLEINDLGKLRYFLGMEINDVDGGILLNQKRYATELLAAAGMSDCKPVSTPMETGASYVKRKESEEKADGVTYRRIVGGLQYLCNTRPDIQYAVGVVSRFVSDPSATHWRAVKRILRYIQGTVGYGLKYSAGGGITLTGLCDADWAGDKQDRKSTSGYTFFIGGNPVSSSSRKQQTVSLSSGEAEYIALSAATQEAMWIRSMLTELGFKPKEASKIWLDNQSALAVAKNPELHSRTKHIDIRHHFIRDCVENDVIEVHYCPTKEMIADILTKALPKHQFQELRAQLGVCG